MVIETTQYNNKKAVFIHSLRPVCNGLHQLPVTCAHCQFVNEAANEYCTNCGYPIHPNADKLLVYELRVKHRNDLLHECSKKIRYGRNALYTVSAMGTFGISFFFSPEQGMVIKGILMLLVGILMFTLARWSIHKPFTALLISFLMFLTTFVINAWSSMEELFTTATGVYGLAVQGVIMYFIFEGVKAAYQAEVLEEEYKL
jgi:hypothetical protein